MLNIKLAIIGMGRMGNTHYAIINSNLHITIESVADPSEMILSMLNKYVPSQTFKAYLLKKS
jgi:hypothetical protein